MGMDKPVTETKMEVTPKFAHNGGFVTEVKPELGDASSAWKQMTSQAGQISVKQRVDPYSKVVLTDGNLGLSGIDYGSAGYEYNIPSPGMTCQPDVSHSDLVNILGQAEAQDQEMQNLSDKLDEFSLGAPLNISPVTSSRAGGKRSSREAEND